MAGGAVESLPEMSVQGFQVSPLSVLSRYWYRSTVTFEDAAVHERSNLRKPPAAVKPLGVSTCRACVITVVKSPSWPSPSEFTARMRMDVTRVVGQTGHRVAGGVVIAAGNIRPDSFRGRTEVVAHLELLDLWDPARMLAAPGHRHAAEATHSIGEYRRRRHRRGCGAVAPEKGRAGEHEHGKRTESAAAQREAGVVGRPRPGGG